LKIIQHPPPPVVDDTELQELRAKIRVLEAKRADDARHVRELETRLSEAESFVALRPKLQAKLSSLQTDLIATRRELADAQQISQLAETRFIDAQEQLEMVMLDKEVAEERAELAEAELEDVKEKLAILEVEVDVLKEGALFLAFSCFEIHSFISIQRVTLPLIIRLRRTHSPTFNSKSKMND
jgi:dynactin 1